jgi:hypothetical protein
LAAISTAIAVAGIGLSAAGAYSSYQGAKGQAEASKQMAAIEMQQEKVRMQAMELSARRQQMEVVRNQQRARSLALTVANSQGAQFGSGLSGGYGQIAGQTGVNLLGISQNLGFGEQMFALNNQLSQTKMQYADAGSQMALGSGLSSLGGTLLNNMEPLSAFGKQASAGFGSMKSFMSPNWPHGIS